MKRILFLFLIFIFYSPVYSQYQNDKYHCVLRTNGINYFTKVAPPVLYSERTSLGKIQTSTFSVTFVGSWSSETQNAFNYAVNIWQYLINSPVQIKIKAEMKALGADSGILAQTGTSKYIRNFSGAPSNNTNYPVALAEALCGTNLNGSEYEMNIEVNSDMQDWYYGTDGNTIKDKNDFVSTILHEIGHGLGITSSINCEGTTGSWGQNYENDDEKGFPTVYDNLGIVGPNSTSIYRLTNTSQYSNPSQSLYSAIVSQNVYFDGSSAKIQNGNQNPKLYAPDNYTGGSSFTHLDETSFPAGNNNSLFSPTLGTAEAIHSPGEVGLAMLKDLGWTINRIVTFSAPAAGMV